MGVHGLCGAVGTILTGVFAVNGGLAYGGGFHMVSVQLLGVAAVIAWVAVTMTVVFSVLKHTIGLRASAEEETRGLDVTEHNLASSYADFMPMVLSLIHIYSPVSTVKDISERASVSPSNE